MITIHAPTRALVFGARGQIGRFLLPRLQAAAWETHAVTRAAAPASADVQWHRLDLFADADLAVDAEVIFSLGPLDGFVAWFERSARRPMRIVAMSSTSASSKRESPDAQERELAQRLRGAEERLLALGAQRGARVTLLRPTLVYGAGLDRNLTRIVHLARRWHGFVLPRDAQGLRQPVHAEDVARAAWAAAIAEHDLAPRYDLPGGETLSYREMVRRVLACLNPPRRLFTLPAPLFRAALAMARHTGALSEAGVGVLARLREDLVFDAEPAQGDLGYAPRGFSPRADMFVTAETE